MLAICGKTGSEMQKLKQTCSTRVFGLQYAFYGTSVGGGVSEIRLPVFVTFCQKCCYAVVDAQYVLYMQHMGSVMRYGIVVGWLDCSLRTSCGPGDFQKT